MRKPYGAAANASWRPARLVCEQHSAPQPHPVVLPPDRAEHNHAWFIWDLNCRNPLGGRDAWVRFAANPEKELH
jgi:hypothetical protein